VLTNRHLRLLPEQLRATGQMDAWVRASLK
jgi:hypothetical protein